MPQTIKAGGLEFLLENRRVGEDGGPSLQVLANIEDKVVQGDSVVAAPSSWAGLNEADSLHGPDPCALYWSREFRAVLRRS